MRARGRDGPNGREFVVISCEPGAISSFVGPREISHAHDERFQSNHTRELTWQTSRREGRRAPPVPQVLLPNYCRRPHSQGALLSLLLFVAVLSEPSTGSTAQQVARALRHVSSVDSASSSSSEAASSAARAPLARRCSTLGDDVWPSLPPGQRDTGELAASAQEEERLLDELSRYFNLSASTNGGGGGGGERAGATEDKNKSLPRLPRPTNLTVLILSWYPPILRLSWSLDEPGRFELTSGRHDFYQGLGGGLAPGGGGTSSATQASPTSNNKTAATKPEDNQAQDKFDLELALASTANGGGGGGGGEKEELEFMRRLEVVRARRELLGKSLSCFQVTYNVVNSRFRVIEEYPAHLRSIQLERVLPATEYNLRVSAVYLNGRFRLTSERVQFVTPTDNESRRFKENTYRPIHSYPDELREPRIGLAQVRCEELTLVAIALFFWLATICLFFNKWGKIRMLEPYQPAYREQLDVGVAVGPPATPQLLGSAPGNVTPSGAAAAGGLLNLSSSSYNLAQQQQQQLVAQSSVTTATGGRHTPSLTSECSRVAPLCQVIDSLCMPAGGGGQAAQFATCELAAGAEQLDAGEKQQRLLAPKRESLGGLGGAAAAARKSSMMILCNHLAGATAPASAFETVGLAAAAVKNRRPTMVAPAVRTDLNYLFQSKAQALAKASLMWPATGGGGGGPVSANSTAGDITSQQFKQGLYRAKFGSTGTGSATADFETLRRLGKCLAARRLLTRGLAAGGPGASRIIGPLERLAAQSCDSATEPQREQQSQQQVGDPQLRLLAQLRNSRQRAQQRQQQQQFQSNPYQNQHQQQTSSSVSRDDHSQQLIDSSAGHKSSPLVSFESAAADAHADEERKQEPPPLSHSRSVGAAACQRSSASSLGSGSQLAAARFIKRNQAVDLTSPRDSFRATATQSLDQSTSDSLALVQATERKLASGAGRTPGTCSPGSCTVEEEEEGEDVELLEQQTAHDAHHRDQQTWAPAVNPRLRRLQFLSKTHQHHHNQITQSASSSTLNRQPLAQQQQQQAYEANSLSLDSRDLHQLPAAAQPQQTPPGVVPTTRKSSKPSSLKLEGRPHSPQPTAAEHHILIEPPSPPNKFAALVSCARAASPLPPELCTTPASPRSSPERMRPSASAFTVIMTDDGHDESGHHWPPHQEQQQQQQQQWHALKSSKSETKIDPHQSGASVCASQAARNRRPEICLDDSPLRDIISCANDQNGQADDGQGVRVGPRAVVAAAAPNQQDDAGSAPSGCNSRQQDAFAKLADSYRASTERRLSRLACARSLAHLSSVATSTGTSGAGGQASANYCRGPAAGACHACESHAELAAAAGHQSLGTSGDTDQVAAVCSCQHHSQHQQAGPTSARLFSIGQQHEQQQQQRRAPKRVRKCSHCGSIECASQQAAMALHQMCALRGTRQQQQQHQYCTAAAALACGEASPGELGVAAGESVGRPRISSVFAACPTYARSHRDSFAMLRALSQRRSKSAEDIAYLSSLVLQIWAREPNPLLQSASQLQLNAEQRAQAARKACSSSTTSASVANLTASSGEAQAPTVAAVAPAGQARRQSAAGDEKRHRKRPRSSLTVANL